MARAVPYIHTPQTSPRIMAFRPCQSWGRVVVEAVLAFVDRNPRWFAVGLILHAMLVVGLVALAMVIAP